MLYYNLCAKFRDSATTERNRGARIAFRFWCGSAFVGYIRVYGIVSTTYIYLYINNGDNIYIYSKDCGGHVERVGGWCGGYICGQHFGAADFDLMQKFLRICVCVLGCKRI